MIPSTDGVTVAAHELGGDGPPLVLCHATGFHARVWDLVAAELTDTYRCVAIDLRGHGDSVIPDGLDLDWYGMAADILAVVDALDLGAGLHAAGWSMGGCSLTLAECERPGLWTSAWAFEPIIFPPFDRDDAPKSTLAHGARRRRNEFASRDEAFDNYTAKPPFSMCHPAAVRSYVDHGFRDLPDGTVTLKCPGPIEAEVFEASFNDSFSRLGEIQMPFTVVGSGDQQGPAMFAPMVAEALPQGTFEPMADLTHFGPIQDPARIAQSIRSALT